MRSRRYELSQRPPNFTINPEHPWIAKGELVFAGLGNAPGGLVYHDSSRDHLGGQGRNDGTLTNMSIPGTSTSGWYWDTTLNRWACRYAAASTQYVLISDADSLSFSGAFGIAMWVNRATINAVAPLIDKYRASLEWTFGFFNTSNRLYAWCRNAITGGYTGRYVSNSDTWIPAQSWHYVVWNHNGGTAANSTSILIDSVQRDDANFTGGAAYTGMINTTDPVSIGRTNTGLSGYFDGALTDVCIRNGAQFSSAEIQQLADPSNVMLSGLILPPKRKLWPVAVPYSIDALDRWVSAA